MIKKTSSAIFKTFLLSLMVIADLHFAFAQSTQQGIIPNGKATFLDQNGKPLTSGTVDFYIPGTTTRKNTYQDINGTTPNTNPVTLDAAGRALLWGTGSYRQVVKDKNQNLIWDVTTSSAGSGSGGGGGTATGDGDLVGTIKPWGGMTAPNQYLFTYGQELSRTTYPALFTAITSNQAVFCSSGSPILTGVGDTTNFWIGMKVEVSCVSGGVTTVSSKTSNSVTLAVNANVTTNTNATFFSWGNGNGSTTFNLPDFRGVVPMGNNIMGGVASSNVSPTYFGATNPNSSGALGGGQSNTLVVGNLPPYTPSGTVGAPFVSSLGGGQAIAAANGSSTFLASGSGSVNTYQATQMGLVTSGAFSGIAQGGMSTPFSLIQPTRTVNFIIKVTPDANSDTASGVTDINGMTGSIACGTGLICTGNTITVNISTSTGNIVNYVSRTIAAGSTIPTTVSSLYVNGFNSSGDGGAGQYIKLGSAPTPAPWNFQSADGAWWLLVTDPVLPKQVGALLDGSTDDSIAMQGWLNYSGIYGVPAFGQVGIALIPTATLNMSANQIIDGTNSLTIKRASNVVSSLLDCNAHNNITVRNLTLDTIAGFSSTSSNTIGNTTQNYTVPAGLVGLVVGNFVQITANTSTANRVNYMIAQINSYSGTTLNVTATTSSGSGTFNNWLIDVYPLNGDLAASNIGLRFTTCNTINVNNNTINNRFYNAYDSRNGNDVNFSNNYATGYVNRGIHAAAYTAGAGAIKNTIVNNHLQGNNFSQYGINTSATDGAVAAGFTIAGNRIEFTNFQGIILGGGVTASSITDNSIIMPLNNNGAGIIIEGVTGTSGLQVPQTNTVKGNTINSGAQGIFILSTFYNTFSGNVISGAGVGVLVSGTTGNSTQFNTFTGNVVQGSVSHGYQSSSGAAASVAGNIFVGNSAVGNGGWGFIADANTNTTIYSGNSSIGNTSGNYSGLTSGVGNVNLAGSNL